MEQEIKEITACRSAYVRTIAVKTAESAVLIGGVILLASAAKAAIDLCKSNNQ